MTDASCRLATALLFAAVLINAPASAQPAVHLGTVTVTEAGGNGVNGVEPGEVGSISVVIFNDGAAASAFDGTLSTSTPGVTMVNGVRCHPT